MTTKEYIAKLESSNKELAAELQEALVLLRDVEKLYIACANFAPDDAFVQFKTKGVTEQCKRAESALHTARTLNHPPTWLNMKDAPHNTDIIALIGTEKDGPFTTEIVHYQLNGVWHDNLTNVYDRNSEYKLFGWQSLPDFPNE